jgi:hypothetical protein
LKLVALGGVAGTVAAWLCVAWLVLVVARRLIVVLHDAVELRNAWLLRTPRRRSERSFVDPAETLADARDPVQTLRKGSRTVASGVVQGNAVDSRNRPICGFFRRNRLY